MICISHVSEHLHFPHDAASGFMQSPPTIEIISTQLSVTIGGKHLAEYVLWCSISNRLLTPKQFPWTIKVDQTFYLFYPVLI